MKKIIFCLLLCFVMTSTAFAVESGKCIVNLYHSSYADLDVPIFNQQFEFIATEMTTSTIDDLSVFTTLLSKISGVWKWNTVKGLDVCCYLKVGKSCISLRR